MILREFPDTACVRSTDPCLSQAAAIAASLQLSNSVRLWGPTRLTGQSLSPTSLLQARATCSNKAHLRSRHYYTKNGAILRQHVKYFHGNDRP